MFKYILLLVAIPIFAERLNIKLSSTNIYETQPIIAELTFKSDENSSAVRLESRGFEADDFEIEEIDSDIREVKRGVYHYNSKWLLKPKKVGRLIIPPQKVAVYRLDRATYLTKAREYKTSPISVNVKRLPPNSLLAGDLTIDAKVDKREINSNLPITLTITIKGEGDLSLIPPFNPKVEDAITFPSSIKISQKIEGNRYIGSWVEKIGYSSDRDFKIPPFKIEYLNTTTDTVEVIETEPINIDVKSNISLKEWLKYISLIALGALITLIAMRFKFSNRDDSDIIKSIKRAKSDRDIYNLLLPYSNSRDISIWIAKLEDNIYNRGVHKIDKREIILSLKEIIESNP